MSYILQISNLNKSFGKKQVLCDININIEEGKIVGILGENESGKTTLFKIIAGLSNQNSGKIYIYGKEPSVETKKIVSYLPEVNHLHKWMTTEQVVEYYREFYNDFCIEKFNDLFSAMNINRKKKIAHFTNNEISILKIALVLSRKAKIYLLDEPIGNVDNNYKKIIKNMIIKCYDEKSIILIGLKDIKDFERIIEEVIILSKGKILFNKNAEESRIENGKSIDDLYKEVLNNNV